MSSRLNSSEYKTLDQWLSWMETSHSKEIDLGLERVSTVKKQLAIDFSEQTVITVAGTNGKGSCVQVLESLLCSNNISCVCFTSPHFLAYNERIRHNGENISDEELIAVFEHIDQQRLSISLSYFEFAALAAMEYAKRKQVDFVILEVGLGGRLDAVNCIDADIAIVTSIGIDHEAWLGNDKEKIATEKCGIFREGAWAVSGDLNPPQNIARCAQEIQANLLQHSCDFSLLEQATGTYQFQGTDASGGSFNVNSLYLPQLPLNSIACALQALLLSPINLAEFSFDKLPETTLTGRWQQVDYHNKSFLLDVAHNPDAANLLAKNLMANPISGKNYAIFSVMADKDIINIIEPLKACFDHWLIVDLPNNDRAAKADEVMDAISHINFPKHASVEAFDQLDLTLPFLEKHMSVDDRCVVFGSFFTVTEFLNTISKS